MPDKSALSHKKSYLNVKRADKSLLTRVGRLAKQFSTRLYFVISLVTTVCLLNSSQVVYGNLIPSKDTADQNFYIHKTTLLPTKEDSRILRLKAVEQIGDRHEQKHKQTNNTVISNLPSSPSAGYAKHSLKPDLFSDETISLQLPPLPSSEEYLPNVFEGYIWPAKGVLTSGYGWRWGRLHRGIDIAAPVGTPILAAAGGKVIDAGWHRGYGNVIELEHLDGSTTLYAHNNRILVSHGQQVDQGEQIAEMGSTGNSTGSHLHFEIHFEDRGAVNPSALLNGK